ncbi:hypothetical protein SNE40_018092 [Patella caerulea]|uniref:Uncharacterized protein n=1 Tax=Patella caerulea TaxID=87958 RepID=A0AAN8J725_PATCE
MSRNNRERRATDTRRVERVNEESDEEEYEEKNRFYDDNDRPGEIFRIYSLGKRVNQSKITIKLNGVSQEFTIDSGSSADVLDRDSWNELKRIGKIKGIRWNSELPNTNLFAYGIEEPLKVLGKFYANVTFQDTLLENVSFIVLDGKGDPLLGKDTAIKLGVLRIGNINFNSKTDTEKSNNYYVNKYPDLFEGVGKLKDFKLKIAVDKDVTPLAQPVRRVPYQLRGQVEQKLKELKKLDIIERVNGPSSWISPVVVSPKKNSDIRLRRHEKSQ